MSLTAAAKEVGGEGRERASATAGTQRPRALHGVLCRPVLGCVCWLAWAVMRLASSAHPSLATCIQQPAKGGAS